MTIKQSVVFLAFTVAKATYEAQKAAEKQQQAAQALQDAQAEDRRLSDVAAERLLLEQQLLQLQGDTNALRALELTEIGRAHV